MAVTRTIHRKVSKAGVDLIRNFEGFVGHPYQDSVGVWTIGYGHTEGVTSRSAHMTEPQGRALLSKDLNAHYAPAVTNTGIPLTQHEFDATVSFVYNLGPGLLAASHDFGRELHARHYRKAADAMLEYDTAGGQVLEGLRRRRVAERHLFLTA